MESRDELILRSSVFFLKSRWSLNNISLVIRATETRLLIAFLITFAKNMLEEEDRKKMDETKMNKTVAGNDWKRAG